MCWSETAKLPYLNFYQLIRKYYCILCDASKSFLLFVFVCLSLSLTCTHTCYVPQVHKISQANVNTEIVFNCQMGRGRTTTGMVIATLVYFHRLGVSGSNYKVL